MVLFDVAKDKNRKKKNGRYVCVGVANTASEFWNPMNCRIFMAKSNGNYDRIDRCIKWSSWSDQYGYYKVLRYMRKVYMYKIVVLQRYVA